MKQINTAHYNNNGIEMIMGSYEGKLCLLDFTNRKNRSTIVKRIEKALNGKYQDCEDEVLKETSKQLDEYFNGKREEFDIPLLLIGTKFQKSVWKTLLDIPYGETRSYKEQARMLGDEKKVRAAANANGANAIAIIIPCHRVIGSNGKLTGYAGGVDIKEKLLKLENESNI
ncbi:MAG: methylated-DNA--[protein]-cysteine S-methyltransferase [Campylobacterota bacterium]|nr:methylated-DNA--[protein]-cysteine S-methyltransferase [Campylobacterota bacterium]